MLLDDLLEGASAAAEYIGVSPRVVYRFVDNGYVPVTRKGRKLYFRKTELERAFRASEAKQVGDVADAVVQRTATLCALYTVLQGATPERRASLIRTAQETEVITADEAAILLNDQKLQAA